MKLKSILVQGPINKPLSYKLGQADPSVLKGVWEMAIASVSYKLTKEISKTFIISSNFVQDRAVVEEGSNKGTLQEISSVLAVATISGKPNYIGTIGIKGRDFFEINSVSSILELRILDAETLKEVEGATARVLVVLRQKA